MNYTRQPHETDKFVYDGALFVKELSEEFISLKKDVIEIFGNPKTQNWYDAIGAIFAVGRNIKDQNNSPKLYSENARWAIQGPFLFVSYQSWNSLLKVFDTSKGAYYWIDIKDAFLIKATEDEDR